jgi:hypothetical protein
MIYADWYYVDQERTVGPFNLAALKIALQQNPDWRELLIWRDGYREWQRAGSIEEIVALFVAPSPTSKKSSTWPAAKILFGISILATAVVGIAFWKIKNNGIDNVFTAPRTTEGDLEKGFADAVAKMRAVLPKKIDATTILTEVDHEGNKMIFKNIMLMDGSKFDEAMKEKLRQSVSKNVCARAETRAILDLGGSFRYLYSDSDARPVLTIEIVKQNC